ncbi:flavodoxin family protein [Caulobacter segnis]|uniref:NAD(P)H dehydrogenase (Quinone) n=2 Tax=Caulobacter segnis TaxID=88688 RepID=D5VP77_CAUST|nr:NAD(P)H-dependent oxidoreductase [Caulobacter segnis]ADG12300.1 NAD(P)H dehydrogenase (quinone) [Caulobacter segnis ATCC 21756]AVQ03894.1 flavodoxin family protein [Caulobacter segnis]
MAKRIFILNGHPDSGADRFCAALCETYAAAATAVGHEVRRLDLGAVEASVLTSAAAFAEPPPDAIQEVQAAMIRAEHLVIVFPLWLGGVPARLKALLEQVYRGGFGFEIGPKGWNGKLKGRSARLVVTMGMPGPFFRVVFGGHGVKALAKGVLWLSGYRPIRTSIVGGVEMIGPKGRADWLARMRTLGAKAL